MKQSFLTLSLSFPSRCREMDKVRAAKRGIHHDVDCGGGLLLACTNGIGSIVLVSHELGWNNVLGADAVVTVTAKIPGAASAFLEKTAKGVSGAFSVTAAGGGGAGGGVAAASGGGGAAAAVAEAELSANISSGAAEAATRIPAPAKAFFACLNFVMVVWDGTLMYKMAQKVSENRCGLGSGALSLPTVLILNLPLHARRATASS